MAEATKKKRRVVRQAKPKETVRERAAKAGTDAKPRRIRGTVKKANKPLVMVGRIIAKILYPFRFVLRPFKTRPVRFVGRLLAKILFINYIRKSWQEVRAVEWPNRRQTTQLTLAVFAFATALTSLVAGTDWVLNRIFKEILLK